MRSRWSWIGLAWGVAALAAPGCDPSGPEVKAEDGAPCVWNVDCVSGLCLAAMEQGEATGWQDGMCASSCVDGCGDDATCTRLDAEELCLPACADGAACRDGYVCSTIVGACLPDCRLGWPCGSQLVCDDEEGVCELASEPGVDFGGPCEADLDCASGICLEELDAEGASTGWVGGVCSESCASEACGSGGACVRLGELLLCVPPCGDADVTCGEGLVCNGVLGACLPDCRLGWACNDGFVCEEDSGSCALEVVAGAALGAPCEVDANCASGVCAEAWEDGAFTGWADGMCVAPCGSASCGDASVCAVLDGTAWCVPACAEATCRDGYACSEAVGGCLPDCRLGWVCGDGLICDDETGACAVGSSGAAFGEPCVVDVDCASGICIAELDDEGASTGWVDGVCSEGCAAGACASGGACVRLDALLLCVAACGDGQACGEGLVCNGVAGACLPDCRLGWACGDGLACDAETGSCALETTAEAALGAPCEADQNCASGVCAVPYDGGAVTGWSDGMCVAPCGSASCGDASVCAVLDGTAWCVPGCDATAACRAGYVCEPNLAGCLPDCRLGWACGDGLSCDIDTGACVTPALAPVGDPCLVGGDCASGICAAASDGWADGMCIGVCGSALCGADTVCAVLDGAAWCLPSCAASCREGYVCDSDYGACLPDCRLGWACLVGYVCGAETGVCEAPTGSGLWDPCDSDDDCDSGLCVLQDAAGSTWTTSRCSTGCGASCPTGFACAVLGTESLCLPTCTGQQDCETTWACDPTVDVCVPSCQAGWICPDGEMCNASGQCRAGGPGRGR